MFRIDAPSSVLQPVIQCLSEAKQDEYSLYLLSDFTKLEQAKKEMSSLNNAILLHPCYLHSVDSTGKGRYEATIFQNGKSFAVVSIGTRNFGDKTNPPNVANLIKMILAKEGIGIQVAPLLESISPVIETVTPNMENSSLVSLATTSLFANKLAQSALEQRELKKLFGYISEGVPHKVKNMLDANSRLSFVTWNMENEKVITNKAGQRIYVQGKTGYQFALGEEDFEIAQLFEKAILTLRGEEEVKDQFIAQLPPNWEAEEKQTWSPVFANVERLIETIKQASPDDITSSGEPEYLLTIRQGSEVENVFNHYVDSLNDRLNDVVITGRHFNPNILVMLSEKYWKHYADFGNSATDPRAIFFWQRVIGRTQLLMPVSLVQIYFASCGLPGAIDHLQKGERINRKLQFEFRQNGFVDLRNFYPSASSGIGSLFAISPGGRYVTKIGICSEDRGTLATRRLLEKYLTLKQHLYKNNATHPTFKNASIGLAK